MWARVTAGQCEHAVFCRANYYMREYCCHDKGEEERDGEGSLMTEGQFYSWREEGFIHLQSEEKEGIIDESAAYNFQHWIKQAVKLHCTVQPVAMESGQAWDRSTPTYMCAGFLFMFFLFHFLLRSITAHIKGPDWMCCLPLFVTEHILEAQITFMPREVCLSAPCWICLASHEGDSAALKSFCVSVPYDSAALCSAHSCSALPSELSITWLSYSKLTFPMLSGSKLLMINSFKS